MGLRPVVFSSGEFNVWRWEAVGSPVDAVEKDVFIYDS